MRFDRMAVQHAPRLFLRYRPRHGGAGRAACLRQDAAGARGARHRVHVRGAPADTHLWFPRFRPAYVDGYGIRPTLLHPDSRGEILLRSTDPREPPRIVYNFFSAPNDLPRLREGFKRAREVAYQEPMEPYRGRETSPGEQVKTDAEIDAFIRQDRDHRASPLRHLRHGHDAGRRHRSGAAGARRRAPARGRRLGHA